MKFAVISDIHGNAPALRIALEDAAAQGAEGYLLAGDYCISAPWANEVVDIIRSLPNAHIIRGNDEAHLDAAPGDDGQFEVSRWCMASLSPDNKRWLDALPDALELNCKGVTIHMAHSSGAFVGKSLHGQFRTSVLAEKHPDALTSHDAVNACFRALWEKEDFQEAIHRLSPGVYIFGHNHIQLWGDFDGRILIDPGACGLPLDCCGFCVPYTLLTIEAGQVAVAERRIPFDAERLIAQAKATGQYEAARVWSEVIFSEWRTSREKVHFFLRHCEEYANATGDARRPFAKETWEGAFRTFPLHP